jgi:hypothetical protein
MLSCRGVSSSAAGLSVSEESLDASSDTDSALGKVAS